MQHLTNKSENEIPSFRNLTIIKEEKEDFECSYQDILLSQVLDESTPTPSLKNLD